MAIQPIKMGSADSAEDSVSFQFDQFAVRSLPAGRKLSETTVFELSREHFSIGVIGS